MSDTLMPSARARLLALECLGVAVLAFVAWRAAWPLVEEWGFLHVLRLRGLGYLAEFAHSSPLRPLLPAAHALHWLLDGGEPGGARSIAAALLVARYLALRWAITPVLDGPQRWMVASLGALLVPWPAAWLSRFAMAQLTLVLVFVALGCALRLARQWRTRWFVAGALAALVSMLIYLGAALCLALVPVAAVASQPDLWRGRHRGAMRSALLRAAAGCALAFALLAAWAGALLLRAPSALGYDGLLLQSSTGLLTATGLWTHAKSLWNTAYGQQPWLPAGYMLAAWVCLRQAWPQATRATQLRELLGFTLLLAALPAVAAIYTHFAHARDADRVLLPVSLALVMLLATALARWMQTGHGQPGWLTLAAIVLAACAGAARPVIAAVSYADTQRQVLAQLWPLVPAQATGTVVLRDTTGLLGDIYVLYPPVLPAIMAYHGRRVELVLCTPAGVTRQHPVSTRYPLATTPECDGPAGQPASAATPATAKATTGRPLTVLQASLAPDGTVRVEPVASPGAPGATQSPP